ncbi:MAG: hypothetical protein ABJG15_16335 [Hyphomonadaceae bacterium]
MIKSLLTAAALIGLATPTAFAHGAHNTRIVTKAVTPVIAVATPNRRVVRANTRRAGVIVQTPVLSISVPVRKVIAAPSRRVVAKTRFTPVRSTRVIRR